MSAALSAQSAESGTPAVTGPTAEPQSQEALRLWYQGTRAFHGGDFRTAASAFEQLYVIKPSSTVLLNLALSRLELGETVLGARHLALFLRTATEITEAERAQGEQELSEAEGKVGRLRFQVIPAGSAILVDGRNVGTAPLGFAWHVEPGTHAVQVTKEGFKSFESKIEVGPGGALDVAVALEAEPRGAGTQPARLAPDATTGPTVGRRPPVPQPSVPTTPPPAKRLSHLETGLVAGGAAATLASGVLWFVQARRFHGATQDAQRLLDEARLSGAGDGPCLLNSGSPGCVALERQNQKVENAERWANIGAVATLTFGAATVGTLIYALATDEPARSEALHLGAAVAPGAASLSVSGGF